MVIEGDTVFVFSRPQVNTVQAMYYSLSECRTINATLVMRMQHDSLFINELIVSESLNRELIAGYDSLTVVHTERHELVRSDLDTTTRKLKLNRVLAKVGWSGLLLSVLYIAVTSI